MRYLLISSLFLLLPLSASADTSLLSTTQEAKQVESALNKQREDDFYAQQKKLADERNRLLVRQQELQGHIDSLSEQFTNNETTLAETEKKLHLESGSLGELFGVVRQVAKELQVTFDSSTLMINYIENEKIIEEIANAKQLPSKTQLYGLWHTFADQLKAGSQIRSVTVPFVHSDGVMTDKEVVSVGAFGLFDKTEYLQWNGQLTGAKPYPVQPANRPAIEYFNASNELIAFDPSQGKLLEQLALKPTLMQRFEQGAGVGKVIVGLLAIGLMIGLAQGLFLAISRTKINAQLKDCEHIGNNALGRILGVYKYDNSPNIEALELRLYETILDEQQKLGRGLSMLKLFAALAPMLGLLGTVTGMIETFQVITEYGNADPKVMAGGISMALVTTVLGLVAAMPLLFLHNVLNSQAESIRTVLEKQGIGLVAKRAEQKTEKVA
ncbi:MotA/TolQ/ExbB proton channel family protein [Psychromonas sp.]|nr:MotA/TolQ/ExbB proton channel family protein [Psychromonas sp.]